METKAKIEINDNELRKVAGAGNQKEEKKDEPKRTIYAGDCFEVKYDSSNTSIRIKVIHDYIEVSALSSIVKVEMRRIYNPTGLVLNEYLDMDMPIIYKDIEEKYFVGNNIW